MKQLYKTLILLLLLATMAGKASAQVTVDATAGTLTGSYATLKAAFDAINIGTHQGAINIRIHQNTTETANSRLDSSGIATGASYTSVLIQPADTATVLKTITLGVSGGIVVDMNGADNVTIDGRPMGTGTAKLLKIQQANPNTNAASTALRLINGVSFFTARYINSECLTGIGTATANSVNISLSTSAATTGNYRVTIDNCTITGGVTGLNVVGTAANFMDSIFITNNTMTNAQAVCLTANNVKFLSVVSNSFSHNVVISGWNVTGVTLTAGISGAVFQFNKNRIVNLGSSSAAQIYGLVVSPSLAAPAVIPQVTVNNNYIGLMATNSAVTLIRAFQFQGTTSPVNLTALNNTIRVGGSGTATTLTNPATVGFIKTNTSTLTSFTFNNNVCINTRTGTANQHVGYFNSQPTLGTLSSDYNTSWGGPDFMAAWGGTFMGSDADLRTAAFPNEQNSTIGNVAFTGTLQPDVATGNSAKLLLGNPSVAITTDIYGTAKDPVRPYRGAYEGAPLDTNDAAVIIAYTYGKIPIGTIDTVRAIIRNNGAADILGLNVTLSSSLSGFSGTTTINLPRFKDTTLFLTPYTPFILGVDTLTISVPADQNNTNNTVKWLRENTLNALTYNNITLGQSGNVGTNPQGEIVAKFSTPVSNFVNQVNVNFTNAGFNGPWPFEVIIYEDSGSTLGPKMVPLWKSATQNTVNGIYNLSIPSIPVSGSFYIGVRQTTANNIGFAFQSENPIRNNTFYFRQGATFSSLPWNDFSVNPANQFRFMIEPRLKINDDLGIIDVAEPGTGCTGGTNQTVRVVMQNLGLLTQDFGATNVTVSGTITSPSNVVTPLGPVVINSGSLMSDDTLSVVLTSTYDMSSDGVYKIKAWTQSAVDNNFVNDTLPELTRTVTIPVSAPYNQTFNGSLALPTGFESNRFFVNAGTGVGGSNGLLVVLNNTSPFAANAFINTPRTSNVTSSTVMRFDYRFLNNGPLTAAILNPTDSLSLFVSTDCGSTYTKVGVITQAMHVSSANYATITVPLDAFAGNDVRVRIQADVLGTLNDLLLEIDNIRFSDISNDMAAVSLGNICSRIPLGSVITAQGTFTNPGINTQTSVPVHLEISGAASYSGTATIASIANGDVQIVSFSPAFTATVAGTYNVKMYASLPGDGDATNDTVTSTFTVVNTNTFTNAGNNVNFNGVFSGNAPNSPTINLSGNEMTLEAWINRSATGVGGRVIISKDSAFIVQYSLGLDAANYLSFNLTTTSGGIGLISAGADSVPLGWSHVAATYNGSLMTIYINGKVVGTAAQTGTVISQQSSLRVGAKNDGTQLFSGGVDELKIWNIAHTSTDIRDSMHTRLESNSSPNLMAYYRFDEAGTGTADVSGNCNALTYTGGSAFTASGFPLGKPMVASQLVFSTGGYIFGSTNFSLNYNTYTGSGDTVYVYKFKGNVNGTSPITNPGGVAAVHPNYWIPYSFGNGTGITADITFTFGSGELLPTVVNSDVSLFSRANGANGGWTTQNASASAVNFTLATATFTETSDSFFRKQLAVGGNNNPLPVKLLYFTGKQTGGDVTLKWATASEVNNAGFTVERSVDGQTFTRAGYVRGKGNSNEMVTYSNVDAKAFAATSSRTLYYRLVQEDANGDREISNTIKVSLDKTTMSDVSIYPNPFSNEVSFNIDLASATDAKITVMDLTGRKVHEMVISVEAGQNSLQTSGLDILPKGMYMLELSLNGETSVHKLLKH